MKKLTAPPESLKKLYNISLKGICKEFKDVLDKYNLAPFYLYKLYTGQLVLYNGIYKTDKDEILLRVFVSTEFNDSCLMPRIVFGINPEELELVATLLYSTEDDEFYKSELEKLN